MRSRYVRSAGIALAVLALLMLTVHYGAVQMDLFRTMADLARLRPLAVGLALFFGIISTFLNGHLWARLVQRQGYTASLSVGLAAFISAGLAGCVANAAGSAVGCAVSLRRHGVCAGRAVLVSVAANMLGFCGVLVWAPVGLVLLARTGMDSALPLLGRYGPAAAACALIGAAMVMLLLLHGLAVTSGAPAPLVRRLLDALPLPSIAHSSRPPLRTRHLLSLVPWAAMAWFASIISFYVLLGALSPGVKINLGDVVGASALAATLGSLAFFVPSGMGVRDGALVALLTHSTGLPVPSCAAAAIAVRALDPLTKAAVLVMLAATARLRGLRLFLGMRAWLWQRWAQRPAHPTLRLSWYLWRAAFAERG